MFKNIIRLARIQDASISFTSHIELSMSIKELNAILSDFNGRIEGNEIIFTKEKDMLEFASKYFECLANLL